jgi:hypothetical protein
VTNSITSSLNATLITIIFGLQSSGSSAANCSVNDGSAYTAAIRKDDQGDGGGNFLQAEIHYRHLVSAGAKSVVTTNAAGTFNCYGYAFTISVLGLANLAPDATNPNSSAGSTNPNTGNATPLTASTISVAAFVAKDTAGAVTFGSPAATAYTLGRSATNASTSVCVGSGDYKIITGGPAAEAASWATYTNANAWAAVIAVFQEAATTGVIAAARRDDVEHQGRTAHSGRGYMARMRRTFLPARSGLLLPVWS